MRRLWRDRHGARWEAYGAPGYLFAHQLSELGGHRSC